MATALIDQGVKKLLEPVITPEAVFANIVPQNQRAPFITFQRVTGNKIRDINGPSGLAQTTFQIDAYSDAYLESKQLADGIRLILDGYRGIVTIGADSVRIAGVSFQAERDFVDDTVDPKLYRSSIDYLFMYDEDI